MGNLGMYQEIVTQAKAVGGVDILVDQIKKGAVAEAMPKILAGGIVAGAAIGAGATKGWNLLKNKNKQRRATRSQGVVSEQELRSVIENKTDDNETDNQSATYSHTEQPSKDGKDANRN